MFMLVDLVQWSLQEETESVVDSTSDPDGSISLDRTQRTSQKTRRRNEKYDNADIGRIVRSELIKSTIKCMTMH